MRKISRFEEIIKCLPKKKIDQLIEQSGSNKYSKHFGCWDQMITMIYGQLSGVQSLRQFATRAVRNTAMTVGGNWDGIAAFIQAGYKHPQRA